MEEALWKQSHKKQSLLLKSLHADYRGVKESQEEGGNHEVKNQLVGEAVGEQITSLQKGRDGLRQWSAQLLLTEDQWFQQTLLSAGARGLPIL